MDVVNIVNNVDIVDIIDIVGIVNIVDIVIFVDIVDTFVVYCTFGYLRPLLMLGLIFGNTWKKAFAANLMLESTCSFRPFVRHNNATPISDRTQKLFQWGKSWLQRKRTNMRL